jgi:hypothetical protein
MQNKDNLKKCNKCQLPETYETIEFDSKGGCNICASSTFKNTKIDWDDRKKQLDKIIN